MVVVVVKVGRRKEATFGVEGVVAATTHQEAYPTTHKEAHDMRHALCLLTTDLCAWRLEVVHRLTDGYFRHVGNKKEEEGEEKISVWGVL